MSLLAIDTATDQLAVAVVDETRVLGAYAILAERPHAIELPQAITRVLKASNLSLAQLTGFAIDIGPGSFTGLRIGVAFLKALVFRAKTPVIGVSSLDVLAAGAGAFDGVICPLIDARRRNVYAALYRDHAGKLTKQSDYSIVTIDELIPMLKQDSVLFLGDGARLYRAQLEETLGARARFAPPEAAIPNAATLGRLGLERLAAGQRDDLSTLVPMYLYPSDCTVSRPG